MDPSKTPDFSHYPNKSALGTPNPLINNNQLLLLSDTAHQHNQPPVITGTSFFSKHSHFPSLIQHSSGGVTMNDNASAMGSTAHGAFYLRSGQPNIRQIMAARPYQN
jgi:hypothetical protein